MNVVPLPEPIGAQKEVRRRTLCVPKSHSIIVDEHVCFAGDVLKGHVRKISDAIAGKRRAAQADDAPDQRPCSPTALQEVRPADGALDALHGVLEVLDDPGDEPASGARCRFAAIFLL
jgi:hypothetical protein